MKPGATTRPSASMTRVAVPSAGTILPRAIATSPRRDGAPVPSMTVPFRISRSAGMNESYRRPAFTKRYLVPLPDVLPLPVAPPEGDDGDCGLFFGCWLELPAEPLADPLVLPDGLLAVPPLPAGRLALSRSQPDKS